MSTKLLVLGALTGCPVLTRLSFRVEVTATVPRGPDPTSLLGDAFVAWTPGPEAPRGLAGVLSSTVRVDGAESASVLFTDGFIICNYLHGSVPL